MKRTVALDPRRGTASLGARIPWMDQARCAGWWRFTEMEVADQIGECQMCPVRTECALYGLKQPVCDKTDTTVWGGLTPQHRAELKRQRDSRLQVVR